MSEAEWQKVFSELILLKEKVNKSALPLIDGKKFFYPVTIDIPTSESAEFNFFRATSFLFVLYFEAGNINIKFISDKISVYKQDQKKFKAHQDIVQKLRTYLQHNLDLTSPRDSSIQEHVHCWFRQHCGFVMPFKSSQWNDCLNVLLSEAKEFLLEVLACIEHIQNDESCGSICKDWCFRISRFHPPFQFDELVSKVASDMGKENIDVVKFRARFYDTWVKKLSLLEPGYDFQREGRKMVEYTLLAENIVYLPITGEDIMQHFEIPPGQRIGQILSEANRIYADSPCTKEQMLEILSKQLQDGKL